MPVNLSDCELKQMSPLLLRMFIRTKTRSPGVHIGFDLPQNVNLPGNEKIRDDPLWAIRAQCYGSGNIVNLKH